MTQTVRRVPGQRSNLRRPGSVYGAPIRDPRRGEVRIDYVGQTRQQVTERAAQHAATQPWSDQVDGPFQVLEYGMWTDEELDARERYWIERLQPRLNYEHNLGNPSRIPIPEQRRQRDERDAARGLTPRQWPAPRIDPVVPRRGWWSTTKRVLVSPWFRWLGGWLVLAIGVLVGLVRLDVEAPPLWLAGVSAAVSTVVVGRLWWWVRGRRWFRSRRRWWR